MAINLVEGRRPASRAGLERLWSMHACIALSATSTGLCWYDSLTDCCMHRRFARLDRLGSMQRAALPCPASARRPWVLEITGTCVVSEKQLASSSEVCMLAAPSY